MRRLVLILAVSGCLSLASAAEQPARVQASSSFNEQWLDTVVSIEIEVTENKTNIFRPIGTGVLLQTKKHHLLLVTAKHVIADKTGGVKERLRYRLNESSGGTVLLTNEFIEGEGAGPWYLSKSSDVACRFMAWTGNPKLKAPYSDVFLPRKEVRVGARLMVLGFPMGLRSSDFSNPIARQGMVARSDAEGIIADTFIFPGNSGGPVLYSPAIKLGDGLSSDLINEEKLVGIVSGFVPYVDVAYSKQTDRARITFEENSGLARIVTADEILSLIQREDVEAREKTMSISEGIH